jgi:hypothetical protein
MSVMPEIERELCRVVTRPARRRRAGAHRAGVAVAALVMAAVVAVVLVAAVRHHRSARATLPAAQAPLGSPGHPAVLGCGAEAGITTPLRRGPADIVVGPVWFPNAKLLPTARPGGYGSHGVYKIPPAIAAGTTVTLTIAASARHDVEMRNPYLQSGASSITYHSCAHQRSFFPQSFAFTHGRRRGCVPLDVRTAPDNKVRHVTLRLFVRHCAAG